MSMSRSHFLPRLSLLALAVVLAGCEKPQPVEPVAPPAEPDPVTTAAAAPAVAQPADPMSAALAGAHRSDANKARDAWRHPQETLAFFGFKPTATVIEITPGGGWYTEVLAPALKGQGTLVAAIVDPASATSDGAKAYYERGNTAFNEKLKLAGDVYGDVQVRTFSATAPSFGDDESADLVLTFRNVHNWLGSGTADAMFQGFFKVLKPGGALGVVEHRAQPGSKAAGDAESGYMTEEAVIALATAAGFELAEKSEINANPKDTADHPNGVWTLPPSLRVPDGEDAEKYKAIGESDRMTLRFTKPRGDEILKQGMDQAPANGD
jgi:predicted methyltransferase